MTSTLWNFSARTPLHALAVVALCSTMAACSSPPPTQSAAPATTAAADAPEQAAASPVSAASLTTHYWDITSIRDAQGQVRSPVQTSSGKTPRLTFSQDGRVVVSGLCNTLAGAYVVDGNHLQVQQIISTRIGCMDRELVSLERLVGDQLSNSSSYAIQQGEPAVLTLNFADSGQWQLTGVATPETRYGSAGETIYLEIGPEKVACSKNASAARDCLKVRDIQYPNNGAKKVMSQWRVFHEEIEGYVHRSGQRSVVRIKRFERKDAASQPSQYAYVYDQAIEVERVNPRRKK